MPTFISGMRFLSPLLSIFGLKSSSPSIFQPKKSLYYSCNACRGSFKSRDEAIRATHEPCRTCRTLSECQ